VRQWARRAHNDEGASAVEYAIVVAGIVLGSLALIFAFVKVSTQVYANTCNHVGTNGLAQAPSSTACTNSTP